MSTRTAVASTLLVGASCLAVGLAAPAYAACDSYSGACPPAAPPANGGGLPISGGTGDAATGGGGPSTGEQSAGSSGGPATSGATGSAPQAERTRTSSASTLPFTGGELVLMTAIGAGAVAVGGAALVAGRRKATPA